jgi:hypothetical protein
MTISNEAVEAALHAHWSTDDSSEVRMRAALEAAAGIIRAECLAETADLLKPPGTLWWGDQGVTVADPPGLPFATLDEWLRARAAAVRSNRAHD